MNELPAAGQIEQHPQGGWQIVLSDWNVQIVGHDGRGLSREEAEEVLRKLNDFVSSRN